MKPQMLAEALTRLRIRQRASAQAAAARALGWARVASAFERLVEWDGVHAHPLSRFEAQQVSVGYALVRVVRK